MTARNRWTAAWICLLCLSPACLTGCGGPAQSPEACCIKVKESIEKKDMGGFYDCLTEESQNLVAGGLIIATLSAKMRSTGDNAAEIAAVMEKHGVSDEVVMQVVANMQDPAAVANLAEAVPDKRAFVAEAYAAMDKAGQGGDLTGKLKGELKDVKIDGDTATATLVTADGEEELDFRKTAAGWKMHIDMAKLSAKAG